MDEIFKAVWWGRGRRNYKDKMLRHLQAMQSW